MSLSLHDIAVPTLKSGLTGLKSFIDKAAAHAKENKIDEKAFLDARLYPDMFAFVRQVYVASDNARRGMERLLGNEPISAPDTETSFAELSERVGSVVEFLAGLDKAAIDSAEDRAFTVELGRQPMQFTGRSYVMTFLIPNILFHITTAYNILRHNGVSLGKRDYLTPFMMP